MTVLGPIAPDTLGPTLMHEHVLCDITPPALAAKGGPEAEITLETCWEIRHQWCNHLGNHRLTDEAVAIAELERLHAEGGRALVELTCAGIAPHPAGLARVSAASGVHIVMGCGFYVEAYLDASARGASVDWLAGEMVAAVRHGMGGIRAGIIGEIGLSSPWTEAEKRVLAAAAVAQCGTGASLNVHPPRSPFDLVEVVEFIRAHGGDPERLVMSHVDRTLFDVDGLVRLADTGCVIEFDFFGIESSWYPFQPDIDLPNDGTRLRLLRGLADSGHLDRIAVSQDICTRTRLVSGGGHGYGHLFRNVIPLMRLRGFTEAEIEQMFVHTPRRLLTIAA
ncbi:phosphotriesterase family protein [Futiania mangrovi]|uniref:Phosphotriesterase-related protein n=1 Tax=Futiania mangrovi TaxID=2959716 RepID=A0A9J6PEF1_9PROT|nr:aryldialkylphosphatase [Futiania mangrovii]MCP1337797.1 hypothetical protein [Futiania mangrovii]